MEEVDKQEAPDEPEPETAETVEIKAVSEPSPPDLGPVPPAEPPSRLPALIQFPRRFVLLLFALLLGTLVIFLSTRGFTGDPCSALLGPNVTPEQCMRLREELGLDRPLPAQYVSWLREGYGVSLQNNVPVGEIIAERLSNSLILLGAAPVPLLLFSLVAALIAVPIHKLEEASGPAGSILKGLGRLWVFPQAAAPAFWMGCLMVLLFSFKFSDWNLPALPATGMYSLRAGRTLPQVAVHLIIPALALALFPASLTAQAVARELTLVSDVDAGRRWPVALLQWIGLTLDQTGGILGALVLVEVVFAWPGIGRTLVEATLSRDVAVASGILVVMALLVAAGRLGAELCRWLARLLREPDMASMPEPTPWRKRARVIWVVVALALLLIPLLLASAGLTVKHDAVTMFQVQDKFQPPSAKYPLGTDELGRNVLPRTLKSITLGLGTAALAAIAALGFGLLFGALTGWLDSLRTWWSESAADLLLLPADALLMIPAIPFVMTLAATSRASTPPGQATTLASIVVAALIPRAVRAYQTLWTAAPQEKRWLVRLLPGAGALFLGALFTALVTIVAADFLGLGAPPPTPTLGGALVSGWRYMNIAPWLVVRPGMMLWLCLTAIYTAADALAGFFRAKEVMIRFNA